MLLREGEARTALVDIRLAVLLAFVAGALNSAGFEAAGFYSANMTGNLSTLAIGVTLGQTTLAALCGLIVLAFLAGASAATCFSEIGKRHGVSAVYARCILGEAVLIAGLGAAVLFDPMLHDSASLIAGIAFAMGMQNATTTRISDARVRSTHITGMITDIGIGFGLLAVGRQSGDNGLYARLRLHACAVLAFAIGGVVGVSSYERFGGLLLVGAGAFLLILALREVTRADGQT
jgi:uncharacterized membrane protein YoaK (UPF0700 family)